MSNRIFDVSTNEKLRYMKKAGTGLVMGVCSCVVGGRARNSMPRFWLAAVLVAVQGVLFGVMLLPLALVYLAGILISGLLSLWRLIQQDFQDMSSNDREANLVPSLNTLYCIALVQCFIFCFRWILRCSRKTLAKRVATDDRDDSEIQLVYKYMSETKRGCEKDPTFVQGRNLITHAVDMIGSDSPADCIQGVQTLYTAICIAEKNHKAEEEDGGKESEDYREQRDIARGQHMLLKHLVVSASSSEQVLQKLLETLNPRGAHDRETRNQAAKIVERLACSISLEQFPMGIQHISSLIGTLEEYSIAEPYVRDCLYDEFEKHWILELGPSAASKPVKKDYKELLLCGLRILRRLAADGNNCRVMSDTPGLLTKIMAPVASDLLHNTTLRHGVVWSDIVDGSMQVMAQLLFTADDLGEISIKLRDEISSCKQAISTLWMILNCNACKEELKGRAIHILTRLCMDTKKQSSRRDDVTQKQSSNSSRYGFVRMLVSIFTHAGKYSSSMRAYAGEGLSLLSSRGEVVHIQEVRGLVQVLVRPDENKTCRQHAAEILEHLCTHCTKDDGRYHAKLKKTMTDAMPMVTEQINSCLPTSHPPNNHEQNVPRAVLLQPVRPATTLLSSLFSLYGTIYDTFVTDLGLHWLEVAHQNKLKEMVVKTTLSHNHPTVQNLVLFKVISKLLISLMRHSGTFRFVQKEGINSFIVELSAASTKMRDLDYSMVFRCATSNSEFTSKLEGCTLASLVKELADMAALHSPASTLFSSPKKSSEKGRWKAKRKPVKPKLHSRKLPAKDKSWAPKRKYNPVEPFLTEDEIKNISWPCQKLHSYCLRVFRSQPGINLSIKHHHFNLSDGDLQIMVPWSDLWNLYSFKELNASLMRCWTLHLFRKCEDEGIPIGFMDPDLMSGQSIEADQKIKNYVVNALVAHWEKDIILVAHYSVEYSHWITIALSPFRSRVTYFDCIKGQDWKKLTEFIDEAWSLARDEKGLKSKNCKLSHSFDYICSGEQVLVECGYYACHKMLSFVECNLPWKNLGQMSGNCDMKEIRNQLCDFFMDELDAMHAPRSFGSTPDFSPNKSERGNGKFSSNYAKFKNSFAEDKNDAPPALDKETEDDSYRIPEEDIAFSTEHLGFDHSDKGIDITVFRSDLCNLNNLKVLDASLMRCWTVHLIEKCRKEQIEIGFLDPHVMSYQTIEGGSKENQSEETERAKVRVLRYLADALVVQQDKRFIIFAHNDYYHWITIAIIPSSSEVYYLDSKKKVRNWEKMQKFIDQAWALDHADGPKLSHHFGFDCDQQTETDTVKCGYYACHNMLLIAEWTLANKEGFPVKLGACDAEMVSSQLKKFLDMKIKAEKNKPASQANSAPPMEKEQASQSSSEPPKKSLKIKKKQE
ncbi:hypothetical protein BRADI_3g00465v3 [Brachypodium distachyon]|uniref:Ubiquitin-like protease family profile domain-containing protein n=1 Tax=Brachypodium distachyon TaxID=15368 RepID=A0A2K2CUH1_BRADI|nr:hypothetical protein BRADI_3g00465v3 [Brachypodium distachyon]